MSGPSQRRVTLLHATALVVASMVGTGIFTTTGYVVAELGHPLWVLAIWLAGGVIALCGANVYGELGAMMPRAGGEYVYLTRALHPAVGFLSGWISLLVGFSAPIAAAAIAFGSYLSAVFPAIPPLGAAVALIAGATALHAASITWGSRVQTAFTLLKVAVLLALVIGGLTVGRGSWEHLTMGPSPPPTTDLAVSLVLVSFAYSGWNAAAYLAGEIREPARNVPRALVGGTALVIALYVALNIVFFYAVPPAQLSGHLEVGHLAARALFGDRAGNLLSLLITIALISAVSAMVMAGPRVYLAMAEDGALFESLARRSKNGTPWASVLLQGAVATAVALTATFEQLLLYIGFTLSLFAALTIVAAFVLRRREPDAPRPYRARGWPLTPLMFLALSLWMVVFAVAARPLESLAGVATLLAGIAVYAGWRGHLARQRAPRAQNAARPAPHSHPIRDR